MQFSYLCSEIFKIIFIVSLFVQNILICESRRVRQCIDPGPSYSVDYWAYWVGFTVGERHISAGHSTA